MNANRKRFRRWLLLLLAVVPLCAQGIITTFAGDGAEGYGGDGGPAARAGFFLGVGIPDQEVFSHIAFDAQGNLYIPDVVNNRVRMVDRSGTITTVAGNGIHGYSGEGVRAVDAQIDWPHAVAFDAAGRLHIADTHNNRVRRVSPEGVITTIAGNGDFDFSGNGGRAIAAAFDRPAGLAFDVAGNLYISDHHNNQVRRVSPAGIVTAFAGNSGHAFSGDGAQAVEAELDYPAGLAFDAQGNLYIADQHNNRIRRVSPAGIITTFAGNGAVGFSGDGGQAVNASLNYPADVAVDGAGNIYIADQRNNRVRRVDGNGIITTVAGNGVQGFSGDGGPPLAASLARPSGLAFDAQGALYITDHYNNRIRKVVFAPPALALSAASLSFAATAGGAAPPAQTVTLTNSGAGALNFTAAADVAWLRVAPASGALAAGSQATLTISVNHVNLSAGDYAGQLTVRSAEASNSPQTVRVALVVRPAAAPAPSFTAGDVAHAASFVRGPIAPGQLVSIFGSNLGPAAEVLLALDPATGRIATTRGGVTVLFNDLPAPLFYVQQIQINVQAPYELAGQTSARIVVRYLESASQPVTVPVAASAPGVFAVARGTGQAALLNEDSSVNSAANAAPRGSVVQIFLTGAGAACQPPAVPGACPPAVTGELPRPPLPAPLLPVTVTIGGRAAAILFTGLAPELAGLLQVNAIVPADTTPGDGVSLEVVVGAASSQPGVTLAVR